MSGLVGWIDFERDLELERPLITALTGTLAQRGPDREAVWVEPHAAFGYRELAVEPGLDGRPRTVAAGAATVTACVSGSPSGLPDLLRRLRSAGTDVPAGAAMPELVAHAYLRWGTAFVPWLDGPFAIAIWDDRTQELVLARDRIGGEPIYYTPTPTGLVFASGRETLLAHPEVAPVVDAEGLRQVISHALPTGPIFAGFGAVESAQIVTYGRGGPRTETYWGLATREHTDDLDATIARVRELLEESIAANLPADPSHLVAMLSGGIDSSSVAALTAAELARRDQGALRTFTIDYQDSEFQADVMRRTKDEPFAREVAGHIGADHTVVALRPSDILAPSVQRGLLASMQAPTRIYDMDAGQYIFLKHAATGGNKIILTGFGGDNAFLGSNWSIDKGLIQSGTFPWLALAQRHGAANGFGTGLLNADTLKALDLPAYYTAAYDAAIAPITHLPGETEWQKQMRRVSYLVLTQFRTDYAMFAATGLQARSPISSWRLLEYAYNIPAAMQGHGGIEKGLLRAAVADLLPERVVKRRRSATPVANHPGYPRRLAEELSGILADPRAPVLPLIDRDQAAERAAAETVLAENRLARADAELVLQLNNWLTHYRVRLTI